MSSTPALTVSLPTYGAPPGPDWRALIDLARAAEDAGVDRVVVSDHVVLGPNTADYPFGTFPTGPDAPWLEPITVLTAVAAATDRIRLATGILIAPLRPAAVLAKTVATLDQLSNGRVDLGVGTGWQREEYDAVGVDFDRRGELLTETITACRAFWEGRAGDIHCEPRPLQTRLPVWFSGTLHQRNVARIVALGDGWIPAPRASTDDIATGVAHLRTAFTAAGRDPAALEVQAPARNLDAIPALAAAGVTSVTVFLRGAGGDLRPALTELVAAFRRR